MEVPTSRRSLLNRLWLGLAGLVVGEYLWMLVSFLRPRRTAAREGAIALAGPVEQFAKGSVAAFPKGRFYLARLADGGFLALSRQCTHLGCTVAWMEDQKRFLCPCHASAYDITGEVVSPPAPRALDLHPVRIENGIVKVDTSTALSRTAFDPSQVTRS